MNKEEKLLISTLKAYLNGESVKFPSDADYAGFFRLAKSHNLSAVVFSVMKNSECSAVPKEIFKAFENSFYDVIMCYGNQTNVINELSKCLSDNKVRHIFFKGAEIRDYFPVPEVRAMGDIDVLIPQDERDRVKKILCSNGFELVHSNGPVYNYSKNGTVIEMHSKIINGKVGSSNAENCFLDAMEHGCFDGYRGYLNHEYHFAYLLTHIAHHFWFFGAGVKLILDLAVMLKVFDLDLDAVLCKMEEIELADFSKIILSICFKWFGYGKEYVQDTASTESFLLSFGAFGNANRNKAAVIARKEMEEGKAPNGVFTRLRLLFPSYKKIKDIPYMKFMEGRPYLLIFGWIYRLFYNLKYRRSFVRDVNIGINSDETKTEAQNEMKYFKEIGLL